LVCAIVFALFVIPAVADSKSATVESTISVSASSGGNVAGEGEVVEGRAESEVFVETRVNGEVVESYDSRKAGEESATAGVGLHREQFNNSLESDDGSVSVETRVDTHAAFSAFGSEGSVQHRVLNKNVQHSVLNTTTVAATSSAATTSLHAAGSSDREQAAPRSLLQRAFKFVAYVFSFKWIF